MNEKDFLFFPSGVNFGTGDGYDTCTKRDKTLIIHGQEVTMSRDNRSEDLTSARFRVALLVGGSVCQRRISSSPVAPIYNDESVNPTGRTTQVVRDSCGGCAVLPEEAARRSDDEITSSITVVISPRSRPRTRAFGEGEAFSR